MSSYVKKSSLIFLFVLAISIGLRASERTHFNYHGQEQLILEGHWTFYWNQLLFPGDSILEASGVNVKLPNFWNDHHFDGYKPQSFGYATYRSVIISNKAYEIALEYTGPHCAQRIFLNGQQIVSTGKVGTNEKKHEGLWLPGTVKTKLRKGRNELLFHVSNFDHAKGGIYKVPIIGQTHVLYAKRERKFFFDVFIAGGVCIIGIFFLGLSIFWRNNRLLIYFGLFTSLFAFWYLNYGVHPFKVAFPGISWYTSIYATYLSFFGFSFFISLFVYEAFKEHYHRYYLYTVVIGYSILALLVLFGSTSFFTSLTIYPRILIFGQILYSSVLLINAVRKKIKRSFLDTLTLLFLLLMSLIILTLFFQWIPMISEFLGLLFMILFLLLGIVMTRKVGGDYRSVLELQKETNDQKEKIEEQATKLRLMDEMKTRFFANVSHDLRSPLMLIKGSTNRIRKSDESLILEFENDLETIDKNVSQLIQFTNEIRDLNLLDQKTTKLNYSEIEMNAFLKSVFNMYQSLAETRNIQLHFRSKEAIVMRIDEEKIRRVLNNLISNAFKFTNNGGRISLSVKNRVHGILIELSDSGAGIPIEEQPFVFDRFYQGKRNQYRNIEGMGIGLALVKELISYHGGNIRLESQLDVGSVFSIFLPHNIDKPIGENKPHVGVVIDSDPQVKKRKTVKRNRDQVDLGQTILLVDDHHEVRDYIASVIDKGYNVIEAENGVDALNILRKEKIDLVITDLMMPWMDGFELIDKMNADPIFSRIKIMVVSARTTREDRLNVLNKGVNEFISKPFDEEEFNYRISNVLNGEESSLLGDLAEKKGQYSSIEENILSKVNALILDHIDNPKLTIAVLADTLATSERNAGRIVKKITGLPPKSYIQQVRMDYVELLIKDGKVKNLTEAGSAIGMQNATQFSKQFEKVKGHSPSSILSIN